MVIDSFLDNLKPSDIYPVLYFYCEGSRTAEECLKNIIRQLLLLPPTKESTELTDKWRARAYLGWDDNVRRIKEMIKKYSSVAFVISDIDKLVAEARDHNYVDLLYVLIDIAKSPERRVKVLISSRAQDLSIEKALEGLRPSIEQPVSVHKISADDQPLDDIKRFVWNMVKDWDLEENFLPDETPASRQQVKREVVETISKSSGPM